MEWYVVVIGTAIALLGAVIPGVYEERRARRKKLKQPSYEALRMERNTFYVWYLFIGFWILMVAPKVDWTYFGYPWTGLVYSASLMVVLGIIRLIYYRIGRKKPNTQALLQEQP